VIGFSRLKWILVGKYALLFRSGADEHGFKKQTSLNFGHANRISRLKVGISMVVYVNVKVTAKRLHYCVGITNRE